MISGIGIDIINIERIERLIQKWGNVFLNRVYTEREILWCQKKRNPYECFALRFAAKEAFLKAIGLGLRKGIQWTDIEVETDPMGKPFFNLHRKAKEILVERQKSHILLTLSHDRPYAVANVILEGKDYESGNC